jgi:hypothetical protein
MLPLSPFNTFIIKKRLPLNKSGMMGSILMVIEYFDVLEPGLREISATLQKGGAINVAAPKY